MLICNDCGCVFDKDKRAFWLEEYGERFYGCPNCKSPDFVQARNCEQCHGAFSDSASITGKLCGDCEHELITPLYDASRLTKFIDVMGEVEPININAFLYFCFSKAEIEHLLIAELSKMSKEKVNSYARQFVDDDQSWAVEAMYDLTVKKGGVIDE